MVFQHGDSVGRGTLRQFGDVLVDQFSQVLEEFHDTLMSSQEIQHNVDIDRVGLFGRLEGLDH